LIPFFAALLLVSTVIYQTGAWHDESSRPHDVTAFLLLGVLVWLLALSFAPYTEMPPTVTTLVYASVS
jgi:hypothetical protein